jgi:hypothetical protein
MPAPSTLTITYTNGSGSPQTYTLPQPAPGTSLDYSLAVRNIMNSGGFWYVSGAGVQTFVPWSQITSISAQ